MKQIPSITKKTRELFSYSALQYMFNTLEENPVLGQVFADDEKNTETCIIFWKHSIYLGGKLTKDSLNFLTNELLTNEVKDRLEVCFIFYPEEEWKKVLFEQFNGSCSCNQYERSLYHIKPLPDNNFSQDSKPQSSNIVEISEELMNSKIDNLDMIREEIIGTGTYNDMKDFYTRGIGYSVVIDNKVCGFCTSEYPSKNVLAIGIEVLEEQQKKGYEKAMTKAFLNKAGKQGLQVYWECWKRNIASVNTARSCGFEKVMDYPVFVLDF